jgi:hypothetical protein
MDPALRTVTSLPLSELWNNDGKLDAQCLGAIGPAEIRNLLHSEIVFALADPGHPLRWLERNAAIMFWKSEAESRIVDPTELSFRLEDFPGSYCYVRRSGRFRVTM